MKLKCHSDIYNNVYYKNDINTTSILHTGSEKSFPILLGEMLKTFFNILILH